MKRPIRVVSFVTLLAGTLLVVAARADEEGISVIGTGEVKAKPSRVEIDVKAAGSAELTGDAIVKYRDALKRAREAFTKLKMKRLQVVEQGLAIGGNSATGGLQQQVMVAVAGAGGNENAPAP